MAARCVRRRRGPRTPSRRAGSASRRVASASTASQQVCQSTPRCRASAETVVSSNVNASVAHAAAREVSFARGGTSSCCSVNTLDRTGRFAAPPQPGQPHQPDRDPETRSVRDDSSPPSVADRDDPAARAAADVSVGLDGQHDPVRLRVRRSGHACPARRTRVGARAPGRARGARRVIHVEAFSSINCLVAVDPEGLDTFIPAPPRRPRSAGTHA